MKNLLAIASIFGISLASNTFASSLDVDINNDTLRGQFNLSDTNAKLGLSGAVMLTDDNGEVLSVTARTQGVLANQKAIKGGFGGRGYYADPENGDSFSSLAIGGFIEVTPPQVSDLTVGVDFYYAPSITTTDDLDNLKELTFKASYQLFENASAYVGLRYLEVENEGFDYEFEDGAHIGFSIQF
ncbi:MAG: YfaZ family protein [Agarilytica sp.]